MTIKELRKEKNLTQQAFASSIGVSVISVRAYEAGRTRPGEKVLGAIKSAYGVDVDLVDKKPAAAKKAAKPGEKKVAKKVAEKKAAKPAAKKAAKPAAKKAEKPVAKKAAEKAAAPKKDAPKKRAAKKDAQIIIQSPLGGEITPFAILAKTGEVDKIYIRVDLNKAFWVKGDKTGSVDLW